MTTQIAVRLTEEELATLDLEVASGRANSRSDALRQSISYLDRARGYRRDAEIAAVVRARGEDLYPDLASIVRTDWSGLD
ncbi:MAG: ribbon-helix-helix domain-containing protein [Propionibacteriaceae bacterium]|jgi:Arc/MetJ-type ribon-helix-helix transcriptional regulator|nr:ribbon-helix-helix domain-containing protein [Propionibacteriaceae bacterium]